MSKTKSAPRKRALKSAPKKRAAKKAAPTKALPRKVMELKVKRMPLASLKSHPRNAEVRKHPEKDSAEWDVLVASMNHDYFDPLVWNQRNGQLVSGHLRRKVMSSMNVTHADVVVVDYDEPTHIARLLAANNLIGNDDRKGMKLFLSELQGTKKFDMSLTGFSSEALKNKFDMSPPPKRGGSKQTGADDDSEPGGDGSSSGNYQPPGDRIPLALSFVPSEHIELMKHLRALRAEVAKERDVPLSEVTNSDAVFYALISKSAEA